jgi:phosphatidylglycerol:prolipoprotein diacylglycerol transferase
MQQVLFHIPIGAIKEWLPDFPLIVYLAAAVLAFALGGWLDKRSSESTQEPRHLFKTIGSVLGTLLILAGLIVFFAPERESLPIFGYGAMLFVAFVACTWLACYLGLREEIAPAHVQDTAILIFLFGIIGGRLTFMFVAEPESFDWRFPQIIGQFFLLWRGGLVFYGAAIGGVVGYFVAHRLILRKQRISPWRMADLVAPCAALGLAVGRVGCLLNGCCYGNVAVCEHCPGIHFPLSSPPRGEMVRRGHHTAAGFALKGDYQTIAALDPEAPVNLQPGDKILQVNGQQVGSLDEKKNEVRTVFTLFTSDWPLGQNHVDMRVRHPDGQDEDVHYRPLTLGLHPTQIYESISMVLLLLLMLAYTPLRPQAGAVMVLFMFGYAIHRFLNESLRTDTDPVAFGLTLSQNISILVIGFATLLALWLRIKTLRARAAPAPTVTV